MGSLPISNEGHTTPSARSKQPFRHLLGLALLTLCLLSSLPHLRWPSSPHTVPLPQNAAQILSKCRSLQQTPVPPTNFYSRQQSDRYDKVLGGKPVLVKNATVWTGGEVTYGDIVLEKGIIQTVGNVLSGKEDYEVVDANGAWVTPGIVDLHSHLAVGPLPTLSGASDGNSFHGPILPWLRSIDGINTHDDAFRLALAGGVTTSLILPGSANAIGGQAFVIKLRPTSQRSPSSMLVEPPWGLNGSEVDESAPPRWRHIKHACGENPSRVYDQTRMDTFWQFRQAYDTARTLKTKQDAYCASALAGHWEGLGALPEDLQWEALVDVLRGKVKVQTHCYEAVDIDGFVRLSNEFKFPVAAFHHAHEAYLVPDVLKRTYGGAPAIAQFATFSRYKREAYRHSEFAPKVLNDAGVDVIMKSDHPGISSRFLLHEAQQAHFWGLPADVALKSVTSTPARVMGLDHRVGWVKEGYDADIVLWSSHPLQLGATPLQVWVDGIPQLPSPSIATASSIAAPRTPDFSEEAKETLKHDGLPPLEPRGTIGRVVFTNVSSIWTRGADGLVSATNMHRGTVAVERGQIVCTACLTSFMAEDAVTVDLQGGGLAPALVSVGTGLGLQEIAMEPSTTDGVAGEPLFGEKEKGVVRAVDGLQFGSRDMLLAYRSGVTTAVSAPLPYGGVSAAFSLGARHKLEQGAVIQAQGALHVLIKHEGVPSVSTQIEALRRRLQNAEGEFGRVVNGETTLVVETHNADIIASLLGVKKEAEEKTGNAIQLTILGGTEAHLLVPELARADVGVIVSPVRSMPYSWEQRRVLPGPPLTEDDVISKLFSHGVTVGIAPQGVESERSMGAWAARNARFDAAWIAAASGGAISKLDAHAMASGNIEKLLGVEMNPLWGDIVVTGGGDLLSLEGKVVAIISPRRGVVDIL